MNQSDQAIKSALTIYGDRIKDVGVILPISTQEAHRPQRTIAELAAVGLTEKTDAIVIVVSKSGTVSIVKRAQISVVETQEQIRQALDTHIQESDTSGSFFNKQAYELLSVSILSLIAVTFIWVSITKGNRSLTTIDAPIEYMNKPENLHIVKTSTNSANVDLRIPSSLLRAFDPNSVKIKLDLAKSGPGENLFYISRKDIVLPPGIGLLDISPSEVSVEADHLASKELPVQIDWVGTLPSNIVIEEAYIQPERIVVIGPSRILAGMDTIFSEKIFVNNLSGSGTLEVHFVLPRAALEIDPNFSDTGTIKYIVKDKVM